MGCIVESELTHQCERISKFCNENWHNGSDEAPRDGNGLFSIYHADIPYHASNPRIGNIGVGFYIFVQTGIYMHTHLCTLTAQKIEEE